MKPEKSDLDVNSFMRNYSYIHGATCQEINSLREFSRAYTYAREQGISYFINLSSTGLPMSRALVSPELLFR